MGSPLGLWSGAIAKAKAMAMAQPRAAMRSSKMQSFGKFLSQFDGFFWFLGNFLTSECSGTP